MAQCVISAFLLIKLVAPAPTRRSHRHCHNRSPSSDKEANSYRLADLLPASAGETNLILDTVDRIA